MDLSVLSDQGASTDRFKALMGLNESLSQSEFQCSVQICEEALQIAIALGCKVSEANAHLKLATALWKTGEPERCRKHAVKGLAICELTGDRLGIAQGNCTLGIVHGILGDYSNALDFFELSIREAKAIGNDVILAHALGNIGSIYFNMQDLTSAIDYFELSLEINRQLGNEGLQGVSNTLEAIAGVLVEQGDHNAALHKIEEAMAIDERIGNLRGKAVALHNLGLTYYKWGRHRLAIAHLTRSLTLSEDIHFVTQKTETHFALASVYRAIGNHCEADHHLNRYLDFGKMERRQRIRSAVQNPLSYPTTHVPLQPLPL